MNKKTKLLNTKDKESLIVVGALVLMFVFIVVFKHAVRYIPLLWLAVAILAVELIFTMPMVCRKYYALYGGNAGWKSFVPLYNAISLFPAVLAVLISVCLLVIAVTSFVAFGPAVLVTKDNAISMMNLSYSAVGVLLIEAVVFSALLGAGYTVVMRDVNQMRADMSSGKLSILEGIYFIFLYLPFLRAFALFNLYNNMMVLLRNGYVVGKDLSSVEIEECEDEEYYD